MDYGENWKSPSHPLHARLDAFPLCRPPPYALDRRRIRSVRSIEIVVDQLLPAREPPPQAALEASAAVAADDARHPRHGAAEGCRRRHGENRVVRRSARPALHLRELRDRQVERVRRLPPRAASPTRRSRAIQPALPLWRRRPGQDASDACDRLAYPQAPPAAPRDLSLGREVHVPVHPRAALQGHDGVQGAVPLGRRADDRRRPVHQRQGFDPGRILPHLQCAGGPEPPDRAVRGQEPADLEGLEERVRSRLGWGLVADIHPTTYELRLGILQSKAEQMGQPVRPRCWNSSPTRSRRTSASSRAR